MALSVPESRGVRVYTRVLIGVTVLLIWWGAAVTTEGVGMAVASWPLMYGEVNPRGWHKIPAFLLEHGHRLIATLVGILTLGLFAWKFLANRREMIWFSVLFLLLMLGSMGRQPDMKLWAGLGVGGLVIGLLWIGFERRWKILEIYGVIAVLASIMVAVYTHHHTWVVLAGLGCAGWLYVGFTRRGWDLVTKLAALALILVSLQAALGGIRVLQVSDQIAVAHGCLAQAFFCVLILTAMAASPGWARQGIVLKRQHGILWKAAAVLVAAVSLQLLFGALMRHHHRFGLADDEILTTAGKWFPGTGNFDLLILFLHKWWAVVILIATLTLAGWAARSLRDARPLQRLIFIVAGLVLAQLTLGICVLLTGKSFWVTNFHVLNGLAILASSFILLVKALRAIPGSILLADRPGVHATGGAAA